MTLLSLGCANGGNTLLRSFPDSVSLDNQVTWERRRAALSARLVAACLAFVLVPLAVFGAPPRWKVMETPRFTVVSQYSEAQTREWATDFNQYVESLKLALKVDERLLPRLTVVMFSRDRDFRPYLPFKPNGESWDVGGYFASRETWAVIGLPEAWREEHTRRAIFHEGAHWFLSQYQGRLPLSLNEGFAEVCSSFEVRENRARWGKPIDENLGILLQRGAQLEPLADLMLTGAGSRAFNSDHRTGRFYAHSWAFVHYLMFGFRPGAQGSFGSFLQALDDEPTVEAAFIKTFAKPSAKVDEDLRRYVTSGKYTPQSRAIDPDLKVSGEFKDAPPEVVQVALARLAAVSKHPELALKHAESAVATAPSWPVAYDTLAMVITEKNPPGGAVEAAEKAISLGSTDALSYVIAATGRSTNSFGGLSHREARRLTNLLEKAVNLCPSAKSPYIALAYVAAQLESVRSQDIPFIEQGVRLFPAEAVLKIGLAQLKRRQGERDLARDMLDAVLRDTTSLDATTIGFVRVLRSNWVSEDLHRDIVPLLQGKRMAEAVALFDRSLSQDQLTWEARQALLLDRDRISAEADLEAAKNALRSGDKTEAVRLLALVEATPRAWARTKQEAAKVTARIRSEDSAAAGTSEPQ